MVSLGNKRGNEDTSPTCATQSCLSVTDRKLTRTLHLCNPGSTLGGGGHNMGNTAFEAGKP